MLSRLSTPSRSLQFLRHFSIRVPSLKKQSLVAQLLRAGNGSPKFTKFTQKGLDRHSNDAKATQQGGASLRSVYQPSPPGVSVEPTVLENGRQQDEDDAVRSTKESKEAQRRDGATKLSAPSLREGSKARRSDGDTQLPVLPKLSVPYLRVGRYGDAKLFQTESRKVKISVQSQIAREEGHCNYGPVDSKPGSRDGKRLALTRKASQEPCLPINGISGSSKEISSLASQIEPGKCITANASTTERGEEDDGKIFVEVHSVITQQKITGRFLFDLQRKIELLNEESAPLTHVKALLTKRVFLSKSPEKLAEVLTVLKLFFESGDKACRILTGNTRIIAQPLEQLQQRLQVLVEFEVDKATCYRLGARPYMMTLKVENYRSVLSFLKELGLSAKSRNRIIRKYPEIMRENRMRPNVNFFESIEIARPTVLKLLESSPIALCMSIDKNLMDMHKVFQHVGLSAEEFVTALKNMRQFSTRHYFSRYNFFREQGLSDEAFANMIKQNPTVLTMSDENLKAKLHFLLHTGKWDISEISLFPVCFNYSLANRIIPRFKILQESNLPRWPSLSSIVICSHSNFMTMYSHSSKCI